MSNRHWARLPSAIPDAGQLGKEAIRLKAKGVNTL
jgi:hypothetical protein